ncbi:MAG: hypothetical protein WAW59_00105 [Patescibacteria group bacterium]
MNLLEQACYDIIMKNMNRTNEKMYLLYDTESPLAKIVSSAYISVLESMDTDNIVIREFKNPPQPLYRGGFINQENPHAATQTRVITAHNIDENKRVGLDHHEVLTVTTTTDTSLEQKTQSEQILPSSEGQTQEIQEQLIDLEIESIKNELISLPKDSIVILVQSTNFRLSTFRIRLELFHRGIHVVEHNHLSYIPETQFDTFIDCLQYRTPEYVRLERTFRELAESAETTRVQSVNGEFLTF